MKNNKNKTSKTNRSSAAAPRTSVDFTTRLAKSAGRFVGVSLMRDSKVVKLNGQVASQSADYVTIRDNNQRKLVKVAKRNIISLTGV